jgi:hypothetical protein
VGEILSADELQYLAERFHDAARRKAKQENGAPVSAFNDDLGGFLREAFLLCMWQVEGTVQALCHPVMSYTVLHARRDPSRYQAPRDPEGVVF